MGIRIVVFIFGCALSGALIRYGLYRLGVQFGLITAILILVTTSWVYLLIYFKRLAPRSRRWRIQKNYRDIGALGLFLIALAWYLSFLDILPMISLFWIISGLGVGVYLLRFR